MLPASLSAAVRAAPAFTINVPIDLRELKNLPPSVLLTMVVVAVALGLAWLYTQK